MCQYNIIPYLYYFDLSNTVPKYWVLQEDGVMLVVENSFFFLFMCKFSPNLYLISYELWVVLTLCQVLGFVLSWLFLLWPRAKSHCRQESPNGWENTVAGYHCISLFLGISEPFHTIYSSWIKDCITHFLNVIHNTDISFRKTLTILHFTIWHKNILF